MTYAAEGEPAPPFSIERVRNDPTFIELERSRSRLVRILLLVLVGVHTIFILLIAFGKSLLAIKVYGVVTAFFPLCLLVLLTVVAVTGIYVIRANQKFDPLTRRIVENIR